MRGASTDADAITAVLTNSDATPTLIAVANVGGQMVRFEGFDEFRRLLRQAEGNWDGALRESNRQIAQGSRRRPGARRRPLSGPPLRGHHRSR